MEGGGGGGGPFKKSPERAVSLKRGRRRGRRWVGLGYVNEGAGPRRRGEPVSLRTRLVPPCGKGGRAAVPSLWLRGGGAGGPGETTARRGEREAVPKPAE